MNTSTIRTLAACTAAAVQAWAGLAQAATVQISNGSPFNSLGASVSDDGKRVAFYSAGNLTGANPDNSFEIYLYDRPANALSQVSQFAGGALAGGNQAPKLSGDGQRLSYQHFVSSGGTVTFQSLLFDSTTGTTALTPMANFGETNELSRDGRKVAIATGNTGLRIFDVPSGTLGPVIAGNTFNTAMSRDGSVLALEFNGRLEVRNLVADTTLQITGNNAGFNLRPDLSDDGRWLSFSSSYDPLGTNADRNNEIFLYDLLNNSVRQITQSTGGFGTNSAVSMSADGSRLAFSSVADLLGSNADLNTEIFLFDVADNALSQITQTVGANLFSFEPAISGNGQWLAFTSSANFSGGNPNRTQQVFLTELSPRVAAVPEPGALGLALMALGLLASRQCRTQRFAA